MEERLLKLLDVEQLSSSKFADLIGVQRSSVSHILSGRNKPSFDFMQKTLKSFPLLNADWLILGEGKMYETGDISGGGSLFDQPQGNPVLLGNDPLPNLNETEELSPSESLESPTSSKLADKDHLERDKTTSLEAVKPSSAKKIVKVILIYDDNSFDSYNQGD